MSTQHPQASNPEPAQAELERLRKEHHQLRQLLEQAVANENLDSFTSELVLYTDPQTQRIVDMNHSSRELLGYDCDEMLTHAISDFEVFDPSQQTVQTYRETGTDIYEYACHYRHRDGDLIPVQVQKRQVPHSGVTVVRYGIQEMALHKRFARELVRRQDRDYQFNDKLQILNEINIELGKMTSFDDVCRCGIELGIKRLGFDRLSLWFVDSEGQTMRGTYGVDESGSLRDERAESWSYGNTFVVDFVNGKRDARVQHDAPIYNEKSQIIDYGWHISAPIVDGNHFIGFIATDNYIHRQTMPNYQPELLRLYGASIGHIASRQREQETIRSLRQQEVELQLEQERIRILEHFVRDVGHEFRTPLSIISTSTYMLSRSDNLEQRKKYTLHVNEHIGYLNKMINDMLYIVKLGSEKALALTRIAFDSLVRDALYLMHTAINNKQLQVQLELTPMAVSVDPDKMHRAITEILKNAVSFTDQRGELHIRLTADDTHIYLNVRDTGIGIEEHEQPQIFQRFYRVNQARTTRGTGLGLSIAKMIVEAHGGAITVESQEGQGSTFTITLNREKTNN